MVVVLFAFSLGVGASLPTLPAAIDRTGGSGSSLGLVLGVFPLAALAGRLIAGPSTDRRGRVVTLRAGLLVSGLAGVLFALPPTVPGIGLARGLHGFADALVYTAASAWVLDRTPESRRPQALSWLGAGLWGGYALGPLAGALVDIRQVGVAVSITSLALAVATGRLRDRYERGSAVRGIRALLPRGVALPGSVLGLSNFAYAAIVGFVVVHLDDSGEGGQWR